MDKNRIAKIEKAVKPPTGELTMSRENGTYIGRRAGREVFRIQVVYVDMSDEKH